MQHLEEEKSFYLLSQHLLSLLHFKIFQVSSVSHKNHLTADKLFISDTLLNSLYSPLLVIPSNLLSQPILRNPLQTRRELLREGPSKKKTGRQGLGLEEVVED